MTTKTRKEQTETSRILDAVHETERDLRTAGFSAISLLAAANLQRRTKFSATSSRETASPALPDGFMKTTLDLPEELSATVRSRIKLPLIECAHEAKPGEEMTPERVANLLLEEEAEAGQGGASSGSDLRALPEKLRSEVGPILPGKSVAGDLEMLELLQIPK